jgi:hypothetical protein
MNKSKFFEKIKVTKIEREVEDVYNHGISMYFDKPNIEHPFGCDGLIDTKTKNNKLLKLIIEYKFEEDFSLSVTRSKIIIQVLYYLKRFEENGLILPNVIMAGDKNECFVFHANEIINYLDEKIDWSIAPSNAHKHNSELILKISKNENFNPFVFKVDENFSFKIVADKIIDLADNIQRYVHVTEHNIASIFEYFTTRVIKDKTKIQPNKLVSIFMGVISEKDDYYQHPTKKNILVIPGDQINIDGTGFTSFFSYFNRNYTPQEKNKFSEISDRLIEDTNRRNKGEFYTPTLFVDYAHKMLSEQFGENWKDDYVVYDACCGTKNLTRDYRFKELYCSTLEDAELEISKRYNPEATSFQYDFLNDDLDKLPENLIKSFEENKPIIFFINPPYGTAGSRNETSKEGIAKTMINKEMANDGIGQCRRNIYIQFLYRILLIKQQYNLTNINIGLYSPYSFLTQGSSNDFRNIFIYNFEYIQGCIFQSSHFSDVSNNWGISFSVWKTGQTENKTNFIHDLIDNIDGEINIINKKVIYNTDEQITAQEWVNEDIKGCKRYYYPQMSSGINIKEKGTGTILKDSLGSFVNYSNSVDHNDIGVSIFTSSFSNWGNVSMINKNFTKCTSLFSARKLIVKTWKNSKDEYLKPNTEHPQYKEFENDSLVYSLFNTSSNQSSLRNVEYKEKKWDIKNEFFFMSKNEIKTLSNEHNNDACYYDANTSPERYIYQLLEERYDELSKEAKTVLDKAKELVRSSFKYRELFNEEHPEYQINNWDCGWYQIKAVLKEYLPDDLKEFTVLYKQLADKMRPMVYDLGFLLK